MYITLNSEDESSNSKFTNYFNDTLIIKPNSYICLAGANFQSVDADAILGIVARFQFRIVAGAYDYSTLITIPQAEYTLNSLVEKLNETVGDISILYDIKFLTKEDPVKGYIIALNFTRKQNYDAKPGELFGRSYFPDPTYKTARRYAQLAPWAGYRTPVIQAAIPTTGTGARYVKGDAANNHDFGFAATGLIGATGNLRVPANQDNLNSFDINRDQGLTEFTVADGGQFASSNFYVCEDLIYNNTTGEVENGFGGDVNTTALLRIETTAAGEAGLFLKKNDNTYFTVFNTRNLDVTTTYRVSLEPSTGTKAGSYALKLIELKNEHRQSLWMPCDYNSVLAAVTPYFFNGHDYSNYQKQYPCGETEYNTMANPAVFFIGPRGFDLPSDYKVSSKTPADGFGIYPSILSTTAGHSVKGYQTIVGPANSTLMPLKGAIMLERTGALSNELMVLKIAEARLDSLESNVPTAAHIAIRIIDDSATGGPTTHTLYGGWDDSQTVSRNACQLTIGSPNITLFDIDGNANIIPLALTSTPATPFPGWAYDLNYYVTIFHLADAPGTQGAFVTDSAGNEYTGLQVNPSGKADFPDFQYIGAQGEPGVSPGNLNERFNGLIWDFRWCQISNFNLPNLNISFRQGHRAYAAYSVVEANRGLQKSAVWYFNQNFRTQWVDAALQEAQDLISINPANTGHPLGVAWARNLGAALSQPNYQTLCGMNATQTRNLIIGATTSDAFIGMNPESKLGARSGLTGVNSANVLTKERAGLPGELPSVELLDPQGAGNDLFYQTLEDINVEAVRPTAVVEIDGDQLQNTTAFDGTSNRVYNVEIENLPHRTLQGATHNISKSIYEIPRHDTIPLKIGQNEIINFSPPNKIWHPLNNGGDLIVNSLDVQISDEKSKECQDLRGTTHIAIEIKTPNEIF